MATSRRCWDPLLSLTVPLPSLVQPCGPACVSTGPNALPASFVRTTRTVPFFELHQAIHRRPDGPADKATDLGLVDLGTVFAVLSPYRHNSTRLQGGALLQ